MKAFINHHLIKQTKFDSGKLTCLGSVFHNFSEPGEYLGAVFHRKKNVADFSLSVDEKVRDIQVDVDLSSLNGLKHEPCDCNPGRGEISRPHFKINPKGYIAFYVSSGPGGFTVRVGRNDGKSKKVLFDSSQLQTTDILAVTLIRPGTYSLKNILTGAKGKIVVAYPKTGKVPYHPPDPITIICSEKGFNPELITLEAARGQIYRFKASSRIMIELVKPDEKLNGNSLA